VPLPGSRFVEASDVDAFRAAFDTMHEQIFTIRDDASAVELVGLRARVRCRARSDGAFRLRAEAGAGQAAAARPVYFDGFGSLDTPVLRWDAIPADRDFAGPALIESPFTTVVIDPPARFRRSSDGALLIEA
jgi:N-methylhydantoinase A